MASMPISSGVAPQTVCGEERGDQQPMDVPETSAQGKTTLRVYCMPVHSDILVIICFDFKTV